MLSLDPISKTPKYKQIVQSIRADIERKLLKHNDQLPSITELSCEYDLARDTVEKAYRELRNLGFITSVQGKGYYVQVVRRNQLKILLIVNKLSSYKKRIYYAFINALGENVTVDLQVHHNSAYHFKEIIDKNLGGYHYYVVMPHFTQDLDKADYRQALKKIPASELILLDKDVPELKGPTRSVHQDFETDIYGALESLLDLLVQYNRLVLILPSDGNYPIEIAHGFRRFCINYQKEYCIQEEALARNIQLSSAYVVIEESDLAKIIKKARQMELQVGQAIGIISFNETTLKELLNITVISTDFEAMGFTAASLLLTNKWIKTKNPFQVIRRGSL